MPKHIKYCRQSKTLHFHITKTHHLKLCLVILKVTNVFRCIINASLEQEISGKFYFSCCVKGAEITAGGGFPTLIFQGLRGISVMDLLTRWEQL